MRFDSFIHPFYLKRVISVHVSIFFLIYSLVFHALVSLAFYQEGTDSFFSHSLCFAEKPKTKKTPLSTQSNSTSSVLEAFEGLGLKLGWTLGQVYLSSKDPKKTSSEHILAQGQASLSGLSLSLFSRPTSGWQISPSFGFQSLESTLKDHIDINTGQANLAGRLIGTRCSWAEENQGGSCVDSNMYTIDLQSVYAGVWLGYVSLNKQLALFPSIRWLFQTGLEWDPVNLFWVKTSLNQEEMSDEMYFNWQGNLLFQFEVLAEWKRSGWLVSLGTYVGQLGTILYTRPLEFRGDAYCDQRGCSRYRTFTDQTQMWQWTVNLSLIKVW